MNGNTNITNKMYLKLDKKNDEIFDQSNFFLLRKKKLHYRNQFLLGNLFIFLSEYIISTMAIIVRVKKNVKLWS